MIGMIDIRYDMDYGMDYGMIGMKYGDFHAGSGRRCPRRPAREATWKAPARRDVVHCCQFEVRQEARGRGEQPFPSGGGRGHVREPGGALVEFRGVRSFRRRSTVLTVPSRTGLNYACSGRVAD